MTNVQVAFVLFARATQLLFTMVCANCSVCKTEAWGGLQLAGDDWDHYCMHGLYGVCIVEGTRMSGKAAAAPMGMLSVARMQVLLMHLTAPCCLIPHATVVPCN